MWSQLSVSDKYNLNDEWLPTPVTIERHYSGAFVIHTKSPCVSFWFSSDILKDADFQGLSESELIFLGRTRLNNVRGKLLARKHIDTVDPLFVVEMRSLTKRDFEDPWHRPVCREFFSASIKTIPDPKRTKEGRANAKIPSNVKKNHFFEFSWPNPKKRRIVIPRFYHKYVPKI